MKRLILMLAAMVAATSPILVASQAAAQGREDRRGRQESRQESRRDQGERRDARRSDDDRRGGRRDDDRRPQRDRARDDSERRDERRAYAPPPQVVVPRGRAPGQAWRRGAYLPPTYRGQAVQDYPRYRLRPPPRGYAWYRVGQDYLLASEMNGLIFDVIID